jgi:hypothetical protein
VCQLRLHTAINVTDERKKNPYTIRLRRQGEEFQKILDFSGLFRPIVGAVIGGKWKILGVTSIDPREVFVDVEEVARAQSQGR